MVPSWTPPESTNPATGLGRSQHYLSNPRLTIEQRRAFPSVVSYVNVEIVMQLNFVYLSIYRESLYRYAGI